MSRSLRKSVPSTTLILSRRWKEGANEGKNQENGTTTIQAMLAPEYRLLGSSVDDDTAFNSPPSSRPGAMARN